MASGRLSSSACTRAVPERTAWSQSCGRARPEAILHALFESERAQLFLRRLARNTAIAAAPTEASAKAASPCSVPGVPLHAHPRRAWTFTPGGDCLGPSGAGV